MTHSPIRVPCIAPGGAFAFPAEGPIAMPEATPMTAPFQQMHPAR